MIQVELILLLVSVSALHVAHQQANATYNATNYLNDLQARQNQLLAGIQNVKSQISALNQTLNNNTLSPNQQLTTLSEGMADERDTLYNMSTYMNLPFEIEPCYPVNLTSEQRDQLQQQINNVNQSLINLQSQTNICQGCPQIVQIQAQIQANYNYLKAIQATVHSGCLSQPYQFIDQNATGLVNLANSLYKDNLKATNWIYGNITQQDYKLQLFTLSTQFNLTSCPIQTPYADVTQKACVVCFGTYNLGQRICQTCSNGTYYDLVSSSCLVIPTCPPGTQFSNITNQCQSVICGPGFHFDQNINQCIPTCASNQYYDYLTQSCINASTNCSIGYYYNQFTQQCQIIVCAAGQIFDLVIQQCVDQNNNTVAICPPDRPYWNSTAIMCQTCPTMYPVYNSIYNRCQGCPNNLFYDPITGTCKQQCSQGQVYNPNTQQCQSQCPQGQVYNPLTQQCELQSQCPIGQIYNPSTQQCQILCQSGQVYNPSTQQCQIPCPIGQLYNPITQQCQSQCPQGQVFNPQTQLCQLNCGSNLQWDYSQNICVCNPGFILNGTVCIPQSNQTCPTGYQLNPLTNLCQSCPNGFYYNATSGKCQQVICNGGYLNPNTQTCLPCPTGTYPVPSGQTCITCQSGSYYDQSQMACVQCPVGNYFDSVSGTCHSCPTGTVYNFTTNQCSIITCQAGYYYSISQSTCILIPTCPANQYFSNQFETCINYPKCGQNEALNYDTMQCYPINQCQSGFIYSNITNSCQKINYTTSPNASNLITDNSFDEYIQEYQQQKQLDPYLQDCSNNSQYYDKNNKICVSCPVSNGYFNLNSNLCQNCQNYNSTSKKCSTTVTVDPTLERLIMNIL